MRSIGVSLMMPSETNISWHLADQLRTIRNTMIPLNSDTYECRYEERGQSYSLRSWHDGRETTNHGTTDVRPEWVTIIIDMARLSGNLRRPPEQPPDIIMWFIVDADNRLVEFIDFVKDSK